MFEGGSPVPTVLAIRARKSKTPETVACADRVVQIIEVDLLRLRTREGMAVARAKGKLKGKPPKLSARQQAELVRMHGTGEYTIADLMEVFSVGRATVYRTLQRVKPAGSKETG
jgi:DNA invertase Pin-like site-specific DNA recombinase